MNILDNCETNTLYVYFNNKCRCKCKFCSLWGNTDDFVYDNEIFYKVVKMIKSKYMCDGKFRFVINGRDPLINLEDVKSIIDTQYIK